MRVGSAGKPADRYLLISQHSVVTCRPRRVNGGLLELAVPGAMGGRSGLGNKETSMCPNEDLVHPKRPGNGFEGERGGTPGRVPGMLVSRSLMHSFARKMGLSGPIPNSPVQVMARRIEATDDKAAIQSKSVLAEYSIQGRVVFVILE